MKKFKTIVYLLSTVLVTTFLGQATKAQTLDKAAVIEKLTNLGFTSSQIETLPKDEIERLSNINAKNIKTVEKYYEVTYDKNSKTNKMKELSKEECYRRVENFNAKKNSTEEAKTNFSIYSNPIIPYIALPPNDGDYTDEVSSGWIKMGTSVNDEGSKKFLFYNSFQWLTTPSIRQTDVFGLGHDQYMNVIPGSERFTYICDLYDWVTGGYRSGYSYSLSAASKRDTYGYAFKFNLKKDLYRDYLAKNHGGYMYYEAYATPSNFVGYTSVYGNYAHRSIDVSISPAIAYPAGGSLNITNTSYYDYADNTAVQFYVR